MAVLLKLPSRCISLTNVLSIRKPVFGGDPVPKRPTTAFGLFLKETFHEDGKISDAPLRMKELSELWKRMGEDEKQVYFNRYSYLKSEYNNCKVVFMNDMDDSDRKKYRKYLKELKKYTREKKQKKEGDNPFPRRIYGFHVYMREKMCGRVWDAVSERKLGFAEAAQEWKNMSLEEKKAYNDKGELIYRESVSQYYQRNPDKAE